MQNSDNIVAYMDDYGKVVAKVPRNFYQGKCDYFYISDNVDFYHDCVISQVEEHNDTINYHLSIPCDLKIGTLYYLVDNHGIQTPIQYRFIVKTQQFDKEFYYDGNDLGPRYYSDHTDFALWAPTANKVVIEIENGDNTYLYSLVRCEKGVYRIRVDKNLQYATYVYYVSVNGVVNKTLDPYAISATSNGERSAIIDWSLLEDKFGDKNCIEVKHYNDAIIYECSVRDMTSLYSSGTNTSSLFISMCEEKTSYNGYATCLQYIKELGVTHIQLMPVSDFATVDENHSKRMYNWGYDPVDYMVLEGSYSTDPNDPYARVREFLHLVNTYHKHGIRVNMDVVFNHMFDVNHSILHKCVPYYYFRYNRQGYISNGSYCGNDIDSCSLMTRKYLIDTVKMFMNCYGVDGFRFDLMGIIDVDTMNQIAKQAKLINPNAMIYGEGWNMPTSIDDSIKSTSYNNFKLDDVAFFNDYFRDNTKGRTADDCRYDQGYLSGNYGKIKEMKSALIGNTLMDGYDYIYNNPNHSINYVECHDNQTSWDKLKDCCKDSVREVRLAKHKLLLASVMFAQGIPFIHSGQEFCRTKLQYSNTYNKPDTINGMDWARRCSYNQIVEYTKACIAIRKQFEAFKLNDCETIKKEVSFVEHDNVLEYIIKHDDKVNNISEVKIIFNPTSVQKYFNYDDSYNIILDEKGLITNGLCSKVIVVDPYSCVVSIR